MKFMEPKKRRRYKSIFLVPFWGWGGRFLVFLRGEVGSAVRAKPIHIWLEFLGLDFRGVTGLVVLGFTAIAAHKVVEIVRLVALTDGAGVEVD